jgi:dolichol-phosphate mannosyltransferase
MLTRGLVPPRFALFALVGAAGLGTHLLCLALLMTVGHVAFLYAQAIATFVAMTENFFLNNLITFRDLRLRGVSLVLGLGSFWLACSFGACVNLVLARALSQSGWPLYLAGAAGIIVSSVWNYSVSSLFTWQKREWPEEREPLPAAALSGEMSPIAGKRSESS